MPTESDRPWLGPTDPRVVEPWWTETEYGWTWVNRPGRPWSRVVVGSDADRLEREPSLDEYVQHRGHAPGRFSGCDLIGPYWLPDFVEFS